MHLFYCLGCTEGSVEVRGTSSVTWHVFTVRSCRHLAQPLSWRTTPLSAVRDLLFNIFAATLHIGGRSSIRNLRTRHAVVTGTHLCRLKLSLLLGWGGGGKVANFNEFYKHLFSVSYRIMSSIYLSTV
jgi:hypothetical protein